MQLRLWLKDIRFWLVLAFLLRLIGIFNAPLEVAHGWRQVTVLMVARNFYELGPDLLLPRVDMAGTLTGITGMEFPLFNYLIYLQAKVFGWSHSGGRLINLVISTWGFWMFFKICERLTTRKVAFAAAFLLIFSLWFQYSRKIMPDTFGLSLVLGGVWYGLRYLEEGKVWRLLPFAVLACLGGLSKVPSLLPLVLLLPAFVSASCPWPRRIGLTAASLLLMAPIAWWYGHWAPHLVEEYGFWHFYMGQPLGQAIDELTSHFPAVLQKFGFEALKISGLLLFLWGLFGFVKDRNRTLAWVLTAATVGLIAFMLKAGFAFHHHGYYILPFVPFMALVAGYAVARIEKPTWLGATLLAVVAIENVASQQHDFFLKDSELHKLRAEAIADSVLATEVRIVINGGENPEDLYFTGRKGWVLTDQEVREGKLPDEATVLMLNLNRFEGQLPESVQGYTVLYRDADYGLFSLDASAGN